MYLNLIFLVLLFSHLSCKKEVHADKEILHKAEQIKTTNKSKNILEKEEDNDDSRDISGHDFTFELTSQELKDKTNTELMSLISSKLIALEEKNLFLVNRFNAAITTKSFPDSSYQTPKRTKKTKTFKSRKDLTPNRAIDDLADKHGHPQIHKDQSTPNLKKRLRSNERLRSASSFSSPEVARKAIDDILKKNAKEIDDFVADPQGRLVFTSRLDDLTGTIVTRSPDDFIINRNPNAATIVISNKKGTTFLLTAYPTRVD